MATIDYSPGIDPVRFWRRIAIVSTSIAVASLITLGWMAVMMEAAHPDFWYIWMHSATRPNH